MPGEDVKPDIKPDISVEKTTILVHFEGQGEFSSAQCWGSSLAQIMGLTIAFLNISL